MSAFILGKDHIDYLVTAAIDLGTGRGEGLYWSQDGRQATRVDITNADAFGAMLIRENVASIRYRYPNWTDLPDPDDYHWERFRLVGYAFKSSVEHLSQVFMAISCYEYQTCEHPEWEESYAKLICDRMRRAYIARLPGYDEAQWEVTREEAN
jgi:hypothetical protein